MNTEERKTEEAEVRGMLHVFKRWAACTPGADPADVLQEMILEYLVRRRQGVTEGEARIFALLRGRNYARGERDFRERKMGMSVCENLAICS